MIEKRPSKIIEGERIRLEARKPSDAVEMFALIDKNRASLAPWMPWEERTKAVKDCSAFIEGMMAGWELGENFDYAIYLKSSGKMVGSFGLHTIDGFNRGAHIGFWIDQDFEGQGYTSEAIALGEKMAAELSLHRLVITCNRVNKRSETVALRNGYHLESTMIDDSIEKGQWRDTSVFVKFVSTPKNLPAGYRFRLLEEDEWKFVVEPFYKEIFDDNLVVVQPDSYLTEEEKAVAAKPRAHLTWPNRRRLALFHGEELAGWSEGFQDSRESFMMMNSAILPKHRGRGLYSFLMNEIVDWATEQGFQRICSRHRMTNNSILIQKLKRGFRITGMELNDINGSLIHMTYYTNQTRDEALNFRAGAKPSARLKPFIKL